MSVHWAATVDDLRNEVQHLRSAVRRFEEAQGVIASELMADEREACAMVAENFVADGTSKEVRDLLIRVALTIRARGCP